MENAPTSNLPEIAIALYERLSARNAELTCELKDMEIHVPSKSGGEAKWKLNGAVTLRTSSHAK
ncbi:MAG: hypothetical protein ABJQ29_02255 [Luteolibacter sp.]